MNKMDALADDPSFIDAIVQEVKSQGLFDQFRKECLADVDTKPAYQNLRQRVEGSVSKFLSEQQWINNIRHKNLLREKLRKNIIGSGFLETGVERIVDQVVNPKISTVFHPKIEEIVYNYLGVEKPTHIQNGSGLDIQVDFLPEDLEAVSPDSDKKSSSTTYDVHTSNDPCANDEFNESREILEDFESPAFEPLEVRPPSQSKHDSNDSHTSAISGLTSQESVESEHEKSIQPLSQRVTTDNCEPDNDHHTPPNGQVLDAVHIENVGNLVLNTSPEIAQNDSQLSQVSSNSRLSVVTSSEQQRPLNPRLDITEEAQMPKFNENSNEEEGELPDSCDDESVVQCAGRNPQKSNFNLENEKYEFKGTERNNTYLELESQRSSVIALQTEKEDQTKEINNDAGEIIKQTSSPRAPIKLEENSSHSEKSLRICEDSVSEQKADPNSSHENCDSAMTPLNDEHSTQSAPDADKINTSQVEVISLSAVQQHPNKEKKSDRHRTRNREQKRSSTSTHRHHSSSSKGVNKGSNSSSKTSTSVEGHHLSNSRKTDHRDRKKENGNSNSNSTSTNSSKRSRKEGDDHYSCHVKSSKKRRSTDRDSNDGADSCNRFRATGEAVVAGESSKDPVGNTRTQSNDGGNLNDSMESNFEGYEDELCVAKMPIQNKMLTIKSPGKTAKPDTLKEMKKTRKSGEKNIRECAAMDVFAFSFVKPAKLGKNGENFHETIQNSSSTNETVMPSHEKAVIEVPTIESLDHFEGVIVLEPMDLEKIIRADEELVNMPEVSSSTDDNTSESAGFPRTNPADLVTLATQPVIVDQIFTNGDNMDLEILIRKKQLCGDDSTIVKIQESLDVTKSKIKKPKIASNFDEARKLMKVRKQMERDENKKREQAMVLAKKLITENSAVIGGDQGIELEFICERNRNNSGPIISSPSHQVTKPNSSSDELDLLYFPEENQVFPNNDQLFEWLKLKTSNSSIPNKFTVRKMNVKLYSLLDKPEVKKSVLSSMDSERYNVITNGISRTTTINSNEDSTTARKKIESDALKMRSSSVESNLDFQETSAGQCLSTTPEIDHEKVYKSKHSTESIHFDDAEANEKKMLNFRTRKIKRLKLSKPEESTSSETTTAILTVDISGVKHSHTIEEKCSPITITNNNNNNGIMKAQQSDLYDPRTLDGIRTRTRMRTNERVGM